MKEKSTQDKNTDVRHYGAKIDFIKFKNGGLVVTGKKDKREPEK